MSKIKRLRYHLDRGENEDESLYSVFHKCVEQYKEQGNQKLYLLPPLSLLLKRIYLNLKYFIGLLEDSQTVSQSTLDNWMKEDFSDTGVCPHKSDYCAECYEFENSLDSIKTQISLHKVCDA